MSNLTHWKKEFNPNYIGSYAFDPGEEKTVTIRIAGREDVMSERGKEKRLVIHFAEDVKPLICNKTNAKMIEKVLGTPFMEQWAGHSIVLGVERVKVKGDQVDAVRVKNRKGGQSAPLICEDCGQIISGTSKLTPAQVVAATRRAFNATLCGDCGKERKERENATDHPDE